MQAPYKSLVLCLSLFGLTYAQEQLRTDLIESARAQKEANLTPETAPKAEQRLESIENSVPYRLLTGELDGFGVGLGTIIPVPVSHYDPHTREPICWVEHSP